MSVCTLVLLRHAKAEYKTGGLVPKGREEARGRADDFGAFDAVYSSPSPRARETAQIISGMEVHTDDRLDIMVPRHLREEVAKILMQEHWSWLRATCAVGGARGAVNQAVPHFVLALIEIAAQHPKEVVLVVAHENHLAGLLLYLEGKGFDEDAWTGRLFETTHGLVLNSMCGQLRLVCRV